MELFKIEKSTDDEIQIIVDGINTYNWEHVPAFIAEKWIPMDYVVKNNEGEVIGGILSNIGYWGGLEIRILWVNEDYRKSGIGTRLLIEVEKQAKLKGALVSILDTFDFQAKNFYLKNGYSICGQIDDFPLGHKKFYLQKRL
jgi:GNAT superfamily N-acetyltransferase